MLAARAGDMVIEANFHPHSEYELDKLRSLGDHVRRLHASRTGRPPGRRARTAQCHGL
jgi:hypothetical protein